MGFSQFPAPASITPPLSIANGGTNSTTASAARTALGVPATTSVPYDLSCQIVGKPGVSAVMLRFIADRAFTLAASGQKGTAAVAATAQADFIVAVNGTTKATLRFAGAGTTITVVGGTSATIASGDIITITAPGSQDATLSDIGFTLAGTLL